jgi:hypothetical protein
MQRRTSRCTLSYSFGRFPRRRAPPWRTDRHQPPASGGRRATAFMAEIEIAERGCQRQMAVVGTCPQGAGSAPGGRANGRSWCAGARSRARAIFPRVGSASLVHH